MKKICTAITLAALSLCRPAWAGPAADALGRCLVASASANDKTTLVRWLFASAALHPALAPMASITPAQRNALDDEMARLVERLLTASCRRPTQDALLAEGPGAIQQASQALVQSAAASMTNDPAVLQGFAGFLQHLDPGQLLQLSMGRP